MKWTYRNQINNFLTAVSNNSEGEIWVYGDITDSKTYEEDVTPLSVRDSLNEMGSVSTLNLRINSYGGSTTAGNSIIDIIDDYKLKNKSYTVAYIEGIAASMASGIAMVADKIYMASNAIMMLHKPYTLVAGTVHDLERTIQILSKTEDTLVKNYMRHFNGTEEELRDLLAKETWLTAEEALSYGLCDEIIEAVQIAASAKGIVINGVEFQHEVEKIAARFCPGTPIAKAELPEHKPKEGENKVVEYDTKLNDYGINEETFKSFNMEASAVLNILENAVIKANNVPTYDESEIVACKRSDIKAELGKDMEFQEVVALAKAGIEIDPFMSQKAKAYDKLVNSAIEDALKNGVRAKGENFNDTKWKKILAGLDYDEILDQSREWDEEARIALNAGKRVSEPYKGEKSEESSSEYIDPNKYSVFI